MYKGILIDPTPRQPQAPAVQDRRKAQVRETVVTVSAVLAVWLSGLGPEVLSFVSLHQDQVVVAVAIYLFFRYLGWLPLSVLAIILASPALVPHWLRERRRRRLVARA